MRVKIKKFSENAAVPFKPTANDNSSRPDYGYDLVAASCERAKKPSGEIIPNTWVYGTGIALQIPKSELSDESAFIPGFCIRPRSSVWKTGMFLTNSCGTIDCGYTGEIKAVFYHYNTELPKYEVGDRIGQLFVESTEKIKFDESDFEDTDRGAGGYGSSGK